MCWYIIMACFVEGDLVDIELPICAHRLYRCVMSSPTDSDLSNAESDLQATIPPGNSLPIC